MKTYAVSLLYFIVAAIGTISNVFVNIVFLANYPSSWLPIFYISQSIIDFTLSYYISPQLDKNPLKSALYTQVICLSLTGFFLLVSFRQSYWLPLLLSLYLLTLGNITGTVINNAIQSAFDFIEFKRIGSWSSSITSISSVLTSIMTVIIIKSFGTKALLYFLGSLSLLAFVFLLPLKPLLGSAEKKRESVPLMKYPLFSNIFYCVIILSLAATFVDFSLKEKLAASFDRAGIGEFMSWLVGISGGVSAIVSFLVIKRLMGRFGTTSILLVLPIYWIIMGLLVALFPSLMMIAIMAAGRYIFFSGFFILGRHFVLNVFPQQTRVSAQFRIRAFAVPLATIIGAFLIYLLQPYLNIPEWALIIFICSLFSLFLLKNINIHYINTLKEEVQLKRFNVNNPADSKLLKDLIHTALRSSNSEVNRFGLSLLSQAQLSNFPSKLLIPFLNAKEEDIRESAIKSIGFYPAPEAIPPLLERMEKEEKPELQWHLLSTLALLDSHLALEQAKSKLFNQVPVIQAAAVNILVMVGNQEEKAQAIYLLQQMAKNNNPILRYYAARIMSKTLITTELKESLIALLQDSDLTVCLAAIKAATKNQLADCASIIVKRLAYQHGIYHAVFDYLIMLKTQAIPLLVATIQQVKIQKRTNMVELIRALASLPLPEVEPFLQVLGQDDSPFIKSLTVKELAYRVRIQLPSKSLKVAAFRNIFQESNFIAFLNALINAGLYNDKVIRELDSRKLMAKKRFLYWLAVYGNPQEIIGFMPTILFGDKVQQAKAIELLNSLFKQPKIVELTVNIFLRNEAAEITQEQLAKPKAQLDKWLVKTILYEKTLQKGGGMLQEKPDLHKIFVLRSVELFKSLPVESLVVIAEESQLISMYEGEVIFKEGDSPTGLFIIVSGTVQINRNGKIINQLKENDFFGELALIDNYPRTASAIAKTEGALLYLDKATFERITDDLPAVLRSVMQTIMTYLRGYIENR